MIIIRVVALLPDFIVLSREVDRFIPLLNYFISPMKLHLPTSLRAALLACISVLTPVAMTTMTGTLATGLVTCALVSQQAFAAEIDENTYEVTTAADDTLFAETSADNYYSTIIMNLPIDTSGNYYLGASGGDKTNYAATIQIDSWGINNCWNGQTFTFEGDVIGSGDIAYSYTYNTSNDFGSTYVFKGDVSAYTGNMYDAESDSGNGLLSLGFQDEVGDAVRTNASGQGYIRISGTLSYSYNNAATISNASIAASTVNFLNGATYTLKCDLYAADGESGTQLTIGDNTTVNLTSDDDTANTLATSNLVLSAGATLNINAGGVWSPTGTVTQADDATINLKQGLILAVDGTATAGTVTIVGSGNTITAENSLSLGGTLKFTSELNSVWADSVDLGGADLTIAAGFTLEFTGGIEGVGEYLIFTGIGDAEPINLNAIQLSGLGDYAVSEWIVDGDSIYANIVTSSSAYWEGGDGNWTTSNWNVAGTEDATLPNAAVVTIGEDGTTGGTITVDTEVNITSLNITGAETWTLADGGDYSIYVGTINKDGAGSATIAQDIALATFINLSEGSLQIDGAMASVGTVTVTGGSLSLNGAVTSMSSLDVSGEGIVNIGAAVTVSSLDMGDGSNFFIKDGGVLTVGAAASARADYTDVDTVYLSSNVTYNIASGGTRTEDHYVRMQTNGISYTIQGGGKYELSGLMLGDASGVNSVVDIVGGSTLHITGTNNTSEPGQGSFILGHWSTSTTVNVDGTLILDCGITNVDGYGTINVADGGELILNQGIIATTRGNTTSNTINMANNSTLTLGAEGTISSTAIGVNVNLTDGVTVQENGVADVTVVNKLLTVTDTLDADGAVTKTAADSTLNFKASEDKTLQLAGGISGGLGTANIIGAGTVSLSGASDSVVTTTWNVASGATLSVAAASNESMDNIIGTGKVNLNGGTLQMADGGMIGVTIDLSTSSGSLAGSTEGAQIGLNGQLLISEQIDTTWQTNISLSNGAELVAGADLVVNFANGVTEAGDYIILTGLSNDAGVFTPIVTEGLGDSLGALSWNVDADGNLVVTIGTVTACSWEGGSGNISDANWLVGSTGDRDLPDAANATIDSAENISITLDVDTTFVSLDLTGAGNITLAEGDASSLNLGTVTKSGEGVVTIEETVDTAGLITVTGGEMNFTANLGSISGFALTDATVNVEGAMTSVGNINLLGESSMSLASVESAASISVEDQSSLTVTGNLSATSLNVSGGTASLQGESNTITSVTVSGGVANITGDVSTDALTQAAGAALNLGADNGSIVIDADAISFGDTVTFAGEVTLKTSSALTMSTDIAGSGKLVIDMEGLTFTQTATSTHTGELEIAAGTYAYGSSDYNTFENSFSNIIVQSGATFQFNHHATGGGFAKITLNGGNLYYYDYRDASDGGSSVISVLDVTADGSTLTMTYGSNVTIESLTGTGSLALPSSASEASTFYLNKIENYTGTITSSEVANISLYLGEIENTEGQTTTLVGAGAYVGIDDSFTKSGEGSAIINKLSASTLDVTGGSLSVNTLTTDGSITKTGAGTLNLSAGNTGSMAVNGGTVSLATGTADAADAFGGVLVATSARLDASIAGTSVVGALNLSDGAIIKVGDAGINLGDSGSLTLGGSFTVETLTTLTEDFSQILFTGVTDSNLFGIELEELQGVTEEGIIGALASDYITTDEAWLTDKVYIVQTADGNLILTDAYATEDLVWNNGESGVWSSTGEGWLDEESEAADYKTNSSVTFNTAGTIKDVVLSSTEAIEVGSMTVDGADYNFTSDADGGSAIVYNVMTVSGDATAKIAAGAIDLSEANVVITGANSSLVLNGANTIQNLDSEGSIVVNGGGLTIAGSATTGGSVTADSLDITGDGSFTQLTVTGDITNGGTLTLGEGSSVGGYVSGGSLVIQGGDISFGSESGTGNIVTFTDFTNGTGYVEHRGEMIVSGTFTNDGELSLSISKGDDTRGYYNLTLNNATAADGGGTVSANQVFLATGTDNTFTCLYAESNVGYGTNGSATGNGGTLTIGDGSYIGNLLGGGLVTTGNVSLGSVASDGLTTLNNGSGTLTVANSGLTVASFTNTGIVNVSGDLTLSNGTTEGGTIEAVKVSSTTGDIVATSITAGDVTLSNGALDLDSLTATGDVSVTGNATLGTATVTGTTTLSGVNDIDTLNATGLVTLGGNSTIDVLVAGAGVVNNGTLTLGEGSSITGELSGTGGLVNNVSSGLNIGSVATTGIASLENNAALSIQSDLKVTGSFDNNSSIDLGDDALILESTAAITGGTVTVGAMSLAGDSSFTQITASDDVTSVGQLTIDGVASTIDGNLLGGGSLVANSNLTVSGTDEVTLSRLQGTADVSFGGALSLTGEDANSIGSLSTAGQLSTAADLTVTNYLSTGTSLVLGGNLSVDGDLQLGTNSAGRSSIKLDYDISTAQAAITAASLATAQDGLSIVADEDLATRLYNLGLGNGNVIEITDLEVGFEGSVSFDNSGTLIETFMVSNAYSATIGLNDDGNVIFTIASSGDEYVAEEGEVWTEGDGSSFGDKPITNTTVALFAGNGESTVAIAGAVQANTVVVDTDGSAGTSAYTFTGEDADVNTGSVSVVQGSLTIDDATLNVHDDNTTYPDAIPSGAIVVGTNGSDEKASLITTENGVINANTVTVNQDYVEGVSGLDNAGTMNVAGAMAAEDHTVNNTGTLSLGDGSNIGNLLGNGTLIVESGKVTLGQVAADAKLNIAQDATLAIDGDASFTQLSNAGTIDIAGTLSSSENENLTLTGTGVVEAENVSVDGTLFIGEGSSLLLGDGTGTTVVSLASFSSQGALVVDGTLKLTETLASGGSIAANAVFAEGGTIDNVTAATFAVTSVGTSRYNTGSLINAIGTTVTSDTTEFVLQIGSITNPNGGKVTLDITALYNGHQEVDIADGTYNLLTSGVTGKDYAWSDFDLSAETNAALDYLVWTDGKDVILDDSTGSLILTVKETEDRTLYTGNNYASSSGNDADLNTITPIWESDDKTLASYSILDTVDRIYVNVDKTMSLEGVTGTDADDSVMLNNLYAPSAKRTLTLVGDGADVDSFTLTSNMSTVVNFAGTLDVNDVTLKVDNDGAAGNAVGTLKLTDANLAVGAGSTLIVTNLDASDANSSIAGSVTLSGGTSTVACGYSDATLIATNDAQVKVDAKNASGLSLEGASGTYTLSNAGGGRLGAIKTTGSNVNLGTLSSSMILDSASTVTGGVLSLTADASVIGSRTELIEGSLSLSNATLSVGMSGSADLSGLTADASGTYTLFTLGSDITLDAASSVVLSDGLSKYFTTASVSSSGALTATRNDSYYNGMGLTENGIAGLNLVSKALAATDLADLASSASTVATISGTSAIAAQGDLADVMADMDSYMDKGATRSADTLAAAVAGATTTSLGSAMMADVERQLRTTRNRTRSMGVDPTVVNPDMPYYNAWIAAEGSSSKLDSDSTHAGHNLTNTGGAIGVDVDLNDAWSVGASFTALIGDLDSDGADTAKGDFDTMYASVYARANKGRWNHSFVASYGMLDATLDRTVRGTDTAYTSKGDTSGNAFALMYEVGYTYAVTEDASTCIQPVFSVSMVNSNVDGYTEKGSDATLKVGDQKNTYVTFGVGGVIETIVGEDIYNRASVFSGRVMLKADAGERTSEADVTLTGNSGFTETVKGADVGALGVELGVGITIPVTEDVGAIFVDASCDIRSGMTSFSGTLGYRFSF